MIFAAAFLLQGAWVLLQWAAATALGIESTKISWWVFGGLIVSGLVAALLGL